MQPESGSSTKRKKKRHGKKKKHAHKPDNENADQSEVTETKTTKRIHSDDEDSNEENVVKKKKKKNKPAPGEPGKKGAKSIRQQKREKHAARLQDAETVAKNALQQQGLEYLSLWKHNKENWKFLKAKQRWLYQHKFSSTHVPDEIWPIFLEYFASASGNIKNLLLEDSKKIIEKMDASLEKEKNENEEAESPTVEKPDDVSYQRAREIIQHLEE